MMHVEGKKNTVLSNFTSFTFIIHCTLFQYIYTMHKYMLYIYPGKNKLCALQIKVTQRNDADCGKTNRNPRLLILFEIRRHLKLGFDTLL